MAHSDVRWEDGPADQDDAVAIVGASGSLGFGLAVRLARGGVRIAFGSRDPGRARETGERARELIPHERFTTHTNGDAVRAAGAVILTVPFESQAKTLEEIGGALAPGQLVIDATVPLAVAVGGRATRMIALPEGSAAERTSQLVPPEVGVVAALHTVSAGSLNELDHPLEQDVLVCGDSRAHRRRAARLLERIEGLRCVDCGRLEMARTTEALTALLISLKTGHAAHAGVRLTGLPEDLWK